MRTLILIATTIAIAGCTFGQGRSGGTRGYSHPGGAGGSYRGRTVYVPYGVPVNPFYSGYIGGYGYGVPYDPSLGYYPGLPYAPYGYDQDAQPPAVVVNQNFQPDTVNPVLNDYTNVPLPPPGSVQTPPPPQAVSGATVQRLDQNSAQPVGQARSPLTQTYGLRDDQPTIFLIAMKDHTIYPVIAYWVDGATSNHAMLNYVTVDTVVKRVPLDQVDRDLSRQLNDQRNVEFKLPAR